MSAVTSVGGLLPKDFLDRVTTGEGSLPGVGPEHYGLAPGERLNDAITRSWNRLTGLWERFAQEVEGLPERDKAATGTTRRRFLVPLLQELGFADLAASPGLRVEGKEYAISHEWAGSVPIHLVGARVAIDRRTPGVPGAAQTSPHGLVQEFLNRSDDHLWAIVANGRFLRILRDNASLTRQAYVEFDLSAMFDGEQYSDFVVLWLTGHRTRFAGEHPESCLLEQWSQEAASTGTRALDKLRDGVEQAIVALGEGVLAHPNPELKARLRSGDLTTADFQRQLLRVIYRILFLLVAESRDLLLMPEATDKARERYRRFYSMGRLRTLATERKGSTHTDLWAGFLVVVRAFSSTDGTPRLGLAPLGSFLWSENSTPDIDAALIDNRHLLDAIRSLTLVRDRDSRVDRSVDYRNLGAEELGSIYEALLELHATVDVDAGSFSLDVAAGNERRSTGTYYTPTSLIVELLDSALDPVIDEAALSPDPESALLALRVLDPACGSGHFLIAAANRIAYRLAAIRGGDNEPSPVDVRHALRDVVGRCLYGIDVNPMAVELCKVSLWMEALDAGLPLSFLEHRIALGNAMLGTTPALLSKGIPDKAYKPLDGDDRDVANEQKKANKQERYGQQTVGLFGLNIHDLVEPLATRIDEIDSLPDDSLPDLLKKAKRFDELANSEVLHRAKTAADAWCTAFVVEKRKGVGSITTDTVNRISQANGSPPQDALQLVAEASDRFNFLHPHIAFPDVFRVPADLAEAENKEAGWNGGFDVVLGNPPWGILQFDQRSWFATRAPEIAEAENQAHREQLIEQLKKHQSAPVNIPEAELAIEFTTAQRHIVASAHFIRSSGRYPFGSAGKVNTYAVFADMIRCSISPKGRAGFICPVGLAIGERYALFFKYLLHNQQIATFYSFENEDLLFPEITNKTKFALVTITGHLCPTTEVTFTGYVRQAHEIHDPARRYVLTSQQIEAINPNTSTAPLFRHSRDAEVTAHIHEATPVLVHLDDPHGNPWGVNFMTIFNMASDSHLFISYDQAVQKGGTLRNTIFHMPDQSHLLPLYEGKMIWHYDYRYGTYQAQTDKQANKGVLPHLTDDQHADPDFSILHRYWVPESLVNDRLADRWDRDWMLGFRDVGPSERTMVCSLIPRVAANDKMPLLFPHGSVTESLFLTATMSSIPFDFAIRQKTSSSMSLFYIQQTPAFPPSVANQFCSWLGTTYGKFVYKHVLELTYTNHSLASLADDCEMPGPPFRWEPERRSSLQAELDALFLHLYKLNRSDAEWVLDSFTVLRKYEERPADRGGSGEFRTKRLVMDFYDRMAQAITSDSLYQSPINPPPAHHSQRHPIPPN